MNGKKIEKETPQYCEKCGNFYASTFGLSKHMKRVHDQVEKSYKCDPCKKGFITQGLLNCHIKQSHRRKTCEICGKSILNSRFLKIHLVFDHDIREGAYVCDVCPRTYFSMETGYKNHMKKHINAEG